MKNFSIGWSKKLFICTLAVFFILSAAIYFFYYKSADWKGTAALNIQSNDTADYSSSYVDTASNTLEKKEEIICLDPGHGGKDLGASNGNINESEINLAVSQKVKTLLENDGYTVTMTRNDDTFIAKRSRAAYCNSINADILVSIHHNSYESDDSVNYATALYYKDSDSLLANSLLDSVSDNLDIKNQGISKFENSLLYIAEMPAALIEGFFITNSNYYYNLLDSDSTILNNEATAIAEGIENYFEDPDNIPISANNNSLYIDRNDSDE